MASSVVEPNRNNAYYVEGDILHILERGASSWRAVDENITDGIILKYWGEPDEIKVDSDFPDVDNSLHEAFVDFLKYKLFLDQAGIQDTGTEAGIMKARFSLSMSREHKGIYDNKLHHYGRNKLDKTGGPRMVRSVSLR